MNTRKTPAFGYDKTKQLYSTDDGLRSLIFVVYRNPQILDGDVYLLDSSGRPVKFSMEITKMKTFLQEGLRRIANGSKEVSILAPDLLPFTLDERDLRALSLMVNDPSGFERKIAKLCKGGVL